MAATLRRVLVADDDHDLCALLEINLMARGLEVIVVHDGKEAERQIREELPDLVVLDVMMPERDGMDVLRSLKADAATASIPVVLLTARARDEQIWEGWEAGADYYLTKPFRFDNLARFIRELEGSEAKPVC